MNHFLKPARHNAEEPNAKFFGWNQIGDMRGKMVVIDFCNRPIPAKTHVSRKRIFQVRALNNKREILDWRFQVLAVVRMKST